MSTIAIIPSRYNSSRFPGKPLVNIRGKSMIRRVYEQVSKVKLEKVIVATDDLRIVKEVESFGGAVIMTSSNHKCGTDRCVEVINKIPGYTNIINVQGDEPFIDPKQIQQIQNQLIENKSTIVTLAKKIEDLKKIENKNCVKVGFNRSNIALWFDRVVSLYQVNYYEHIGIYGFKTETLKQLSKLSPTENEKRLNLEQLRWMDNGHKINVLQSNYESISIDTPEDLKKIVS